MNTNCRQDKRGGQPGRDRTTAPALKHLNISLDLRQQALQGLAKEDDAISIERLGDNRLQFRWKDLCEQYDYAELGEVISRNRELAATRRSVHEVLAKHIATRFLMQRVHLVEEVACEESA